MLTTIDLAKDQVETVAITSSNAISHKTLPAVAQQKLEEAKAHIDQAAHIMQNEAMPYVNRAICILLEINNEQAWEELGYKSMRQLILAEFEDRLNLSSSQIYRLVSYAEVRQDISPIDKNTETIPNSQLEELGKVPDAEHRREVWKEITATAPQGRVTAKHAKNIVNRYLTGSHNNNQNQPHYELPEITVAPEKNQESGINDPNGASISISAPDSHQIITIRANDRAIPQQEQYFGCWGIVSQVLEGATTVAVGGESVEYASQDLEYVIDPSPSLMEVSDRVTNLWKIPNLPALVRHLLVTFYQRKLHFSQEGLEVLTIIENFCQTTLSQEYSLATMQNQIKDSGIYNQIPV